MGNKIDKLGELHPTSEADPRMEICGRSGGKRIFVCSFKVKMISNWKLMYAEMRTRVEQGECDKRDLINIRDKYIKAMAAEVVE